MKKITGMMAIMALLLSSCGGNSSKTEREEWLEKIKSSETAMHKNPQLDPVLADSVIANYLGFTERFSEDGLTPDFLFKAAEICTAVGKYQQASVYYRQIREKYPKYPLYVESCYLEASLYDNYLNKDGDAKGLYQKLIEEFPDSPYSNDAKAALQNLGKTDEELIREFNEKNKGKN